MSVAALSTADCIRVSGGYDYEPRWLNGKPGLLGTVERFIPGQNAEPAVVVRLDGPITVEGYSGDILVLELRNAGAKWDAKGTVHVELCSFPPESKPWSQRKRGKWVESHASYERVESGAL